MAAAFYTVASFGQSYVYCSTVNSGNRVATITGPVHTVTNTWETDRNVLASKENKVGSVTRSKYSYTVNDLGQRIVQTTAGDAFGSTNRGWTWGYNYFGEVVKATHAASFTLNRAYAFDNIGNRISATEVGSATTNYIANALSQYITINPGTAVSPVYDLDGNPLEDKGINGIGVALKYNWDAENRLIAVRRASDGASIASYTYDPFGRRIRKTTTAIAVQGASDIAYLYDGWNVVAEYTITSGPAIALNQGYIWGLDLSGSPQGAGGVGGLLAVLRTPSLDGSGNRIWGNAYQATYDGNGNVSEYMSSSGAVADHHEYDPFGKLTTAPLTSIAYRFSTKPYDPETGLYYYGYRYYDPTTGRWRSRDPIEEEGGVNLYGFLNNRAIGGVDYLGLEWTVPPSSMGGAFARQYCEDKSTPGALADIPQNPNEPAVGNQLSGYPANVDFSSWIEREHSHMLADRKKEAKDAIEKALKARCGQGGGDISVNLGELEGNAVMTPRNVTPAGQVKIRKKRKDPIDLVEHPADIPQSWWQSFRTFGRHNYQLSIVTVVNVECVCFSCYVYSTKLQVTDTPGVSNEDDVLSKAVLTGWGVPFNSPSTVVAEWDISGVYCCE